MVATRLEYLPGHPVQVRVVHRERRISVTDNGEAVRRAGRPPRWRDAVDRVLEEFDINITRDGIVWLPVVEVGPGEEAVVQRIAQASLSLYQELLELRT
jgi:hypothetical protein